MYVQKGPTEFASIPVYPDEESFHKESGWFESAPADVCMFPIIPTYIDVFMTHDCILYYR